MTLYDVHTSKPGVETVYGRRAACDTSGCMDVVYAVKSGDWMAKIAEEHGTTVSAIWNHPGNAEHRAKRGSPNELYPGDVLVVPSALAPPSSPPEVVPAGPPEVVPASPPAVAPWPFPPPETPAPSPFPTWSCPEGICTCDAPGESGEKVPHTIVFYGPGGLRMPHARCMVYELGRAITSPTTAADALGELVVDVAPHTRSLWVEWCPADLPLVGGMPYGKRYHVAVEANPIEGRLSNLGFAMRARIDDNVSDYQRAQGLGVTGRPADIADDLKARHDDGRLLPFIPQPHVVDEPETADAALASFLAEPPPFDRSVAAFAGFGVGGILQPGPQGGGGGTDRGGVVPNVGHLLLLVGLEPDNKALAADAVTLRLWPMSVPGLPADDRSKLIHPTASVIPWPDLPASYLLFGFTNVRAGSYAAIAHAGGVNDAHRGYALGRIDIVVRVGLLNLGYVPVTRDRPILTTDDPLLELDVEAMQRRRKVLATVFVDLPQSADRSTAPGNMPPYQQGPYKSMLPGLDATNTCAPINVLTMQKAGARGHEFGFGQVLEVKDAQGKTTGVKPRSAFVKYSPGLAPSVGDSFLGTDKAGFFHHCGVVVRSSPRFGELWFTADGGQPDRTSPFQKRDGTWRRFYVAPHFPGSREAAYILPRLLTEKEGRARLGNRFIFPGATTPSGDFLFGWTDITHPTVSLQSAYTKDITEESFRAMQRHVRTIVPRAEADIRRAEEEERRADGEDVFRAT